MTKTYAQITREIAALQSTANKLYALEVKEAVAKINGVISKYKLSAADLMFARESTTIERVNEVATDPGANVARGSAKYGDGQGRVWSGRGPRPAWLRSALDAGRSLESLLVAAKGGLPATTAKAKSRASSKLPAQKSPTSSVPKYQHSKTGLTWSGRGPRPQWLKAALRKRGSAIEDFLIGTIAPSATDGTTTPPAPAGVAAATKAGAEKPASRSVARPLALPKPARSQRAKK